ALERRSRDARETFFTLRIAFDEGVEQQTVRAFERGAADRPRQKRPRENDVAGIAPARYRNEKIPRAVRVRYRSHRVVKNRACLVAASLCDSQRRERGGNRS